MRAALLAGWLWLGLGCVAQAPPRVVLGPLEREGEVTVYLQPPPAVDPRVTFTLASLAAVGADGVQVPLALVRPEISLGDRPAQRRVAWGRLAPGEYTGLVARFARATLAREEGAADLLLPEAPTRIAVPFRVERARAGLIEVSLQRARAAEGEFKFQPVFSAIALQPAHTLTQLDGYCSQPALASVSVFDKHRHEAVAVIASGREPQGLALDGLGRRLYVALAGQDQVQILDLSTGEEVRRVALQVGDRPRELALTADGTLLVANGGSGTVAFVDAAAGVMAQRVAVGEEPQSLLLDRGGRRAYVFNRRSNNLSVLDLSSRSVVATVQTDAEPLRGQLNRAGTRLYVIHRGSQYVSVLSVPDLSLVQRLFVGLGASALKVDPKTDLLYVALEGESRIQVFDPFSTLPVDWLEVPDPVSHLTIDDAENALLALVPSQRAVVFIDLTSKRTLGVVEVGADPFVLAVEGERN